jgi:hypothetical protein
MKPQSPDTPPRDSIVRPVIAGTVSGIVRALVAWVLDHLAGHM